MESMEHEGSGREDDDGSEDDAWIEDEGEEEAERGVNASEIHTSERKDSNLSSKETHKESEELEPGDEEEATTKYDNAMSGKKINPEELKEVEDAVDFSVDESEATSNDSSVVSDKTINIGKHKEMEGAAAPEVTVPMDTTDEDASGMNDKSVDPETSEGRGALDDLQPEESSPESQENPESPTEQMQDQGQSKLSSSKVSRTLSNSSTSSSSSHPSSGKVCRTLSNSSASSSQPSSKKVCRTLSNSSVSSSSSVDETTYQGEEFCATCYQGFDSIGEWCDHLSTHSIASLDLKGIPGKGQRSLMCATCTMCKKVFPVVFNKPGPFKCKICTKLFPGKSSTNKNVEAPTGSREQLGEMSSANKNVEAPTGSQEQLGETNGASQQDSAPEQVVFKCNLCLKGFTSLEGLMKHFSRDHKSLSCQVCMKVVQDWECHMERFHKDDSKYIKNKLRIEDLLRSSGDSVLTN